MGGITPPKSHGQDLKFPNTQFSLHTANISFHRIYKKIKAWHKLKIPPPALYTPTSQSCSTPSQHKIVIHSYTIHLQTLDYKKNWQGTKWKTFLQETIFRREIWALLFKKETPALYTKHLFYIFKISLISSSYFLKKEMCHFQDSPLLRKNTVWNLNNINTQWLNTQRPALWLALKWGRHGAWAGCQDSDWLEQAGLPKALVHSQLNNSKTIKELHDHYILWWHYAETWDMAIIGYVALWDILGGYYIRYTCS